MPTLDSGGVLQKLIKIFVTVLPLPSQLSDHWGCHHCHAIIHETSSAIDFVRSNFLMQSAHHHHHCFGGAAFSVDLGFIIGPLLSNPCYQSLFSISTPFMSWQLMLLATSVRDVSMLDPLPLIPWQLMLVAGVVTARVEDPLPFTFWQLMLVAGVVDTCVQDPLPFIP